ncbi:SRPBCC family protein [bacterium SCSIO 12741]|nr:SRPBCC family protein [bacterium SCSIO 12741]
MNAFRLILIGFATLFIAYFTVCIFSPARVAISQTRVINEPIDEVYANISDLDSWTQWHQWFRELDSGQYVITSIDSTGSQLEWFSQNGKGGKLLLTQTEPHTVINTTIAYEKDQYEPSTKGEFLLEAQGKRTKVSWVFVGREYPFFLSPATLIWKELLNDNYETGLINLAAYCEGRPIPKAPGPGR